MMLLFMISLLSYTIQTELDDVMSLLMMRSGHPKARASATKWIGSKLLDLEEPFLVHLTNEACLRNS